MNRVTLPYGFHHRSYQIEPWNEIMDPSFKRGVMVIPRRNGKDLLCWNALIAKAMERRALYFYMGPFYNQIRQIIWQGTDGEGRRFLDYIPPNIQNHPEYNSTKLDMRVELPNGSQIKLQGSDNIDSIVGTNPYGIVFTEFSLHKPEAWDYLRPILAENGGWALFNGTPRGLNHFYELAMFAEKEHGWYYQYLTRDDTGVPTVEAIEEDRRSGMPESLIRQEYYCSWVATAEEVLIPLDALERCINTQLRETDFNHAPRIIGADPAFAVKGDQAVISKRQGRFLHPLQKFRGLDNMSFATRIANEINSWRPQAVMIDAGRGEGVISRLVQLGYGEYIIPVHFSGRPFSDLYLNKRAEIWCKMRDWILADARPMIPHDEDMLKGMTAPTFWHNDRGFIQIEGKKHIKDRLKRHAVGLDEADAVAVTFAEDLATDQVVHDPNLSPSERYIIDRYVRQQDEDAGKYDVLDYLNNDENYLQSLDN